MSGTTTLPLGTSPCRAFFECVLKLTLEEAMKALDGGEWSMPRPGLCTVRKGARYPRCRRPGEPRGRSGLVRKISPPHAFDSRTAQSVPIVLSSPPFFFFFEYLNKYWLFRECHNSLYRQVTLFFSFSLLASV